jgi:hypothetical protein
MEEPDISKANILANSSREEGQFAVKRFSFVFTTFRPKHLLAFSRTKIAAVAEFSLCKKEKCFSELTLC